MRYIRQDDAGNKKAQVYEGELHSGNPEILDTPWGPVTVTDGCYVFSGIGNDEKFVVHPTDLEQFWQKAPK